MSTFKTELLQGDGVKFPTLEKFVG